MPPALNSRRRGVAILAACIAGVLSLVPASATEFQLIGREPGRGPIFLLVTGSFGGAVVHDVLRPGFGAAFLLRPQAADHFLRGLYRWNTGLVMQAEYRPVTRDRRLLAAELVLRRYAFDLRGTGRRQSAFGGIGFGASEITFPQAGGTGHDIWFSLVVEGGHEWTPSHSLVMQIKVQYRFFRHGGRDYSGWSVHAGAGMPLPW